MKTINEVVDKLRVVLHKKNEAYGDTAQTAGEMLRVLYPDGVAPDQYDDMLIIVRILDKLGRVATGDTSEDPFLDIAGYGVLGART